MTDVSVIGLGPMGLALARALLRAGHRATVWNRTAAKGDSLVQDGGVRASSAADALRASPVAIICVADYAASHTLLASMDATSALDGKVLVQLSTGTPQDARDAHAWSRRQGADYIDGAILATPNQIGRPDTPLFLSGSASAFQASESLLKAIAGNVMYMGEAVGAASAWDLATLSWMFGAMFGFTHGARICESEDLPVDAFGAMAAQVSPVIGEMIKQVGDDIHTSRFAEPESSMNTCAASGDLFLKQAREARINTAFPAFAVGQFSSAMAAGYANERFAALIKVLRTDGR